MAGIRALLGLFPKTGDYEGIRNKLDEEYNDLIAFKSSKELRDFNELKAQVQSEEFLKKKKEILSLKFKNTDDFKKENQYKSFAKSGDIKLFYKIKNSQDLIRFNELSKSDELKRFGELEAFLKSDEFASEKKEASLSKKEKFGKSDLAKTLHQHTELKQSARIRAFYKFVKNKAYKYFIEFSEGGGIKKLEELEKEVSSNEFKQKLSSLVKTEKKSSEEYRKLNELRSIKKSKAYKAYHKLENSQEYKHYKELHGSDELEAFEDIDKFINSPEFKRQRNEIESKSFKDTQAYKKLEEHTALKKSDNIRFYFKFESSKGYKNYLQLKDSERIKEFETLEKYIKSDSFIKFKGYCLKNPKKRWTESSEYEVLQDYELKEKSEKITWYFKNINHKRFAWHRSWTETFHDDFSGAKLDTKKWLTRYYWGDKMFKGSYSLSRDKHFVTDGKNINLENKRLHIVTKKEEVKGNSWDPKYGFVKRDFGYTSGLVNTALSFKQKYGIFEAKVKITESTDLQNSFSLMGQRINPHIHIATAGKKLWFGNHWQANGKENRTFKKAKARKKFSSDFFIYTLEWLPGVLIWKINGVEIARSNQGVPDEEMYVVLSAGLQKQVNGILPAQFEVDWVKCFQKNDIKSSSEK